MDLFENEAYPKNCHFHSENMINQWMESGTGKLCSDKPIFSFNNHGEKTLYLLGTPHVICEDA